MHNLLIIKRANRSLCEIDLHSFCSLTHGLFHIEVIVWVWTYLRFILKTLDLLIQSHSYFEMLQACLSVCLLFVFNPKIAVLMKIDEISTCFGPKTIGIISGLHQTICTTNLYRHQSTLLKKWNQSSIFYSSNSL